MKTNFLALVFLFAVAGPAWAAGPFLVTVTSDTHAVTAGSSPNDIAGHVSLRSAIEAANAQIGATTITVPPGVYTLSLGELEVATNSGKNIAILGIDTAADTVINQTDTTNRVLNFDPNARGNNTLALAGLTISGGHDKRDFAGGAGILAGSITNTPKDVLNLTNCVVANNHCSLTNIFYTAQIGGGLQMAGGNLNVSSCLFSNNSSGSSSGGAIAFFVQSVASSLNVNYSTFANNSLTNTSGSGPIGGGAIFIGSTSNSVHTILNSVFANNQALGVSGNTYGGAIDINTGNLNITNTTFTGNAVIFSAGGQGGALYVDSGSNSMSLCRLVGNTAPNGGGALFVHNSNGATSFAVNDWWGCNGSPGALGCDVAGTDAGGLFYSPYLLLTNSIVPTSLVPGQSGTLTASFINTSGAFFTPAQLTAFIGLPVAWNNAALGTLSNPQLAIQAGGTATATYTAGSLTGTGHASATVDNGMATAIIPIVCPSVTAAVGGGGTICPGGAAQVIVAVSGGVPPYIVTLNNAGGTQTNSSPLSFSVSPTNTTTYQIISGQDAEGCPVTGSGGATVTIILPNATITTVASVLADSSANLASGPAGQSSYAWTIANGFIIGPTNQSTISYIAGVSGTVVLGLTTASTCGALATTASYVPIMLGLSVHTNLTFTSGIVGTTMTMAFDGTNYWDCSGGTTNGARLGTYTTAGALISTYSPGFDFRSVFTSANGKLFARAYNTNVIYQQTSPGVFVLSGVTLTGGTLFNQSSVVLNGPGTEYIAVNAGVVSRWSTNGAYLGSVTLQGFGSLSGENNSPQNRGIAALGNYWLTYNGAGILSAWDFSGNRLFQTVLPGAGTTSASDYSFSCCNGKVFIVDAASTWHSFDIFSGAAVAVLAAEQTTTWTADVTNKIFGTGAFQRVDLFPVFSGNPLPSPAQLRAYKSVLVFSDSGFADQVGIGNELADYVDQGGGVVLCTFGFWNSTAALGMSGRLTNSYLPFTAGTQSNAVNATLVADLPADPLLAGVNSFNGGANPFLNWPISIAPGATLVAHWNNGQPLVGKQVDGSGRCAGLNFFPPSSDAFPSYGWNASTDGARLMANALLWAAQLPTATVPTITSSPADRIVALGQTATFSVGAVGAPPLSYQWQFNGTNLPAATNNVLSFTAQSTNLGQYSVVVANPYGQVVSAPASLNPPLRFLTPQWSGTALSLLLANTDGSAVTASRAARVEIFATTNLSLPLGSWMLLSNAVVSTGGQLQVNGLPTAHSASLFFRAAEVP